MQSTKILWADDEIDLLKPHIKFLEAKGYVVTPVVSGTEAVDEINTDYYDVVFLDENMPGISGLEAVKQIKAIRQDVPIVMITKSEEEYIMEDAIGSQIADYLIKPVNPNQILHSLKKLLDNKKLVGQKVTMDYQREFSQLSMQVNGSPDEEEWIEIHKKLIFWDLELEKSTSEGMKDVLESQRHEANTNFCHFIDRNYLGWLKNKDTAPVMSHTLLQKKLFPLLDKPEPTYFFLIDNLRYDQWKIIQPIIADLFRIEEDTAYYGILPSSTNYARNAIFAGLMPSDIEKRFPKLWINDEEEGGKNLYEQEFFEDFLKRNRRDIKFSYNKITNLEAGKNLVDSLQNYKHTKLNIIVYNFVDLLSHVRTEMEVIRELAEDEAAYRSLTLSWFEHSPLLEMMKYIATQKVNVLISTDHGSIKVKKASKIIGDRATTTNLRYKNGKNLNYNEKEVFSIRKPEEAMLPKQHVSSSFVFAKDDYFFVYPNNFNHFVNMYKNTFQHGGVSMHEMIIPVITMSTKN
jgi:CheY-like chemotaxis protein